MQTNIKYIKLYLQKLVVDRLRKELELYQQRLRARNKQVSIENDNRYVAQQLREHQLQFYNRSRTVSLLKPSVLNEIQIKTENNGTEVNIASDSDNENRYTEKENTICEINEQGKFSRNFNQIPTVHERSNLANTLNKVKEALM